ncbi:MAG: hypothetical protein LH609_08175 [Rudanella sp.]|nr:hypothetical protein [Rudanella sp.]
MQLLDSQVTKPPGFWDSLAAYWHRQSQNSLFLIKLRSWEYWPFWVIYTPVLVYYGWLSLKARSWFFFSASNPGIENGGMRGESKMTVLNKIEGKYKPKTLFFRHLTLTSDAIVDQMMLANFWFPIIAKPDRGERGFGVEKLDSQAELTQYLTQHRQDLIVQEYVAEPLELGVFYYRFPGEATRTVYSIVVKDFLGVTGDGRLSIARLLARNERALLQREALEKHYGDGLNEVLQAGETRLLMPIGNHCRGTKFLNGNHLITPELRAVFDRISLPVSGFHYGRFDLRCRSIEHLLRGETIRIVELNGVGSEPAHIYQPGFSIWEGWRVLLQHWRVPYAISRANHRLGVPYMTLGEAWGFYQRSRANKQAEKP